MNRKTVAKTQSSLYDHQQITNIQRHRSYQKSDDATVTCIHLVCQVRSSVVPLFAICTFIVFECVSCPLASRAFFPKMNRFDQCSFSHRMYNSDPEQPMESTGIDPQNRELKRFKVMTAVLVIAFVISISIASGFLVHQKNEHRDAIHDRDESITELNQQLAQLKEEQNHRETELKEQLQQMEKERDEEKKSVESLKIDILRAHKLEKQLKEEVARFTEERVTLKFEMERKKELWKNLNRKYIEQLADSMSSNVKLQKELDKVTAENELREQKSKHHEEENKILRQIISQKKNEIATVVEERDNLQREVKDLRDEIESIKIQPAHCDSAFHHLHAPPTSDNALSEVGPMRVWVEQIRVGVQDLLLFKTLSDDDRIIEVRYDDDVIPVAELADHIRNWMINKIRDGHWTQVLTQYAEDVCFSPETLHSLFEDVVEENRIVISLLTEKETNAAANGYGSGQYLENLKQKNVGIDEQEFGKMIEDMRITAQTLSQQNVNIYIKILDDGSCIGALARGDQEQDDGLYYIIFNFYLQSFSISFFCVQIWFLSSRRSSASTYWRC